LRSPETTCLLALTESRYGKQGWKLLEEAQKRAPKIQVAMLDPKMSKADLDEAASQMTGCSQMVVAAYVTVAAYRGNVALSGSYPDFVNGLIAGKAPVILASLGNPYLFRNFPDAAAYLTTMSSTTTSETALISALFGETSISGKLPVTIPGMAKYGDGIQINAIKTAGTR
jgi:beta-N-acetylhexosaminidase